VDGGIAVLVGGAGLSGGCGGWRVMRFWMVLLEDWAVVRIQREYQMGLNHVDEDPDSA
jgi:hypothetical protein